MTGDMDAHRAAGPACSSSGHSRTSYFEKMKLTCSKHIWIQERKKLPSKGSQRSSFSQGERKEGSGWLKIKTWDEVAGRELLDALSPVGTETVLFL